MARVSALSPVTPMSFCVGPDALASLRAASDAAGEGKCWGPRAAVVPIGSRDSMAQGPGALGADVGQPD